MNPNMNNMNPQTSEVKSHIGENMKEYNTATMIDTNYTGPQQQVVVQKVKNKAVPFLLLVILLFGGAAYLQYTENQKLINYYKYEFSPITSTKETKLDINSPLVQQLYSNVRTTGNEDYANYQFNDDLKRYLAYRFLSNKNLNYKSNCNGFDPNKTIYYSCNDNEFNPISFKASDLDVALVTLFGANHGISHDTIQLGKECIGGFQYIEERKEYVQGLCTRNTTNLVNVDKELVSAKSTGSHIYLEEKVRYYPSDNSELPSYLISGNYKYSFRLDENYNYIYTNREYIG